MVIIGSNFQFGYNTGVINAPQTVIEAFFNESYIGRYGESMTPSNLNFWWGFAVAIFAAGGMVGSVVGGVISKRLGLKPSMLYNNALAIIAALLMGLCKLAGSFEMLIIGRLVIGINCGINMVVAPMYLTEIAPVEYRGVFGVLGQLGVVTTILLSQALGLQWVLGTEDGWPLLLGITGLFAVFQLITIPFCPESPRYLMKDQPNRSEKALRWLRGSDADITDELNNFKKEAESEANVEKTTYKELFTKSSLQKPLLIAVVMQLSQQLSGINAVFYYSTDLFIQAGISPEYSSLVTVGMGVVNVVMVFISVMLIDRAGRRILHLVGLAGMFVCAVVLVVLLNLTTTSTAVSYLTVAPILLFVAFFQSGPGSIPWFITSEIFDQSPRPLAVSVAGVTNWLGNFAVGLAWPSMVSAMGGYGFLVFAVLLLLFWLFTYFKVPETKGKSISEITALFQDKDDYGSAVEKGHANQGYKQEEDDTLSHTSSI